MSVTNQRAIIDRRELSDALGKLQGRDEASLRKAATTLLKPAYEAGRVEIARRIEVEPMRGREAAAAQAFLTDQMLRLIYDFTTSRLYPLSNPTASQRLCLAAVGGYGRAEMAPFSDVDIAFLTPHKPTSWSEQVIESILYTLWDLGLKVGHSTRSIDDVIRMTKDDLTVRTAYLEARYIWGDQALYDDAAARFQAEVVAGSARAYIAEKLEERDARHKRMGDSRYVVEPNLKEGKGGLRDLHTLFWIGKYVHRVQSVADLVDKGLLSAAELKQFQKAENFLWAVRCHLHLIAGRGEERLTFDVQREIAARMHYQDRPGRSAVERFMQHYFLNAKTVGDLTGLFLAHLNESFVRKSSVISSLTSFRRAPKKLNGFVWEGKRISIPDERWFREDPVRLIELFALADQNGCEIHPVAMRAASRDAKLIDAKVRNDPRANALFLDILTSPREPEYALRWMNEASVFGRFVPDFGRVVAQMQFDMYHHFTVDEHSIRAIGLLSRLEKGVFAQDHPHSTAIMRQVVSRRALYVAVLLHDIAKGRGGDHSVLGAEVALKLCPRLGLSAAETETVAWLVRAHLLMSATAFKRDLADFKAVKDFADLIQSPERLKLLLVLTVVDIRAVGPGVWNSWKGQLLTDLFEASEEVLRLGHKQRGRNERIEAKRTALKTSLDWPDARFDDLAKRLPDAYIIAEPDDIIEANARLIAEAGDAPLTISATVYPSRGATLVTVYAADHPGLFYRIAGGIHAAGGSIIDARIHTTKDGMALDNFLIQDPFGDPFDEPDRLRRIEDSIRSALADRSAMVAKLRARPAARTRAEAFPIAPNVLIDNAASNRQTVIEVNARDRPALLNALAHALFESKVTIRSAHIATYGERAVDTFYVTDLIGDKITSDSRLKDIESRLLAVASGEQKRAKAA